MEVERVEFAFSDGTTVTFNRSSDRWISWTARVVTKLDRSRDPNLKRPNGTFFSDDCLKPTLVHAQRLIKQADQKRAQEVVGAGTR